MLIDSEAVIIGCDHAAYILKEKIKAFITEKGRTVVDVGTFGELSVDYPDFAIKVAEAVSRDDYRQGILLCGTGIGMSIVANRYPNVRAALCNDLFTAIMSKRHNNANILVMGARVIGDILALEIVKTWLETPFEGGRHQMRIDKFNSISKIIKM